MHTYTKAEREAYKAGCKAVERRVAAAMADKPEHSNAWDALTELWALLSVDNQVEAVQAIKNLHEDKEAKNDVIKSCYREIDSLHSTIKAAKHMGEHYRKERDDLKAKFIELANLTPPAPVTISANLGFASTGDLLDEIKKRLWKPSEGMFANAENFGSGEPTKK